MHGVNTITTLESADRAAPVQRAILQMTPVQALTTGFELEADIQQAHAAVLVQRPNTAPQLVGEQFRQGFQVGGLNLMVRYEDGSELTEMPEVYCLPNAPAWFCGMANLHGMLTPVFDLARYFHIARNTQAKPMLLVLSRGADAAGVVIDGMPERLRWSADDQIDTDSAPRELAPHLRGACLIDERIRFDLDCTALLDSLEHAMQTPH